MMISTMMQPRVPFGPGFSMRLPPLQQDEVRKLIRAPALQPAAQLLGLRPFKNLLQTLLAQIAQLHGNRIRSLRHGVAGVNDAAEMYHRTIPGRWTRA